MSVHAEEWLNQQQVVFNKLTSQSHLNISFTTPVNLLLYIACPILVAKKQVFKDVWLVWMR